MRYNIIFCFAILFSTKSLISKEGDCSEITTTKQLVQCTLLNHPDLQALRLKKSQKSELKTVASQIPNLELSSRVLYGTSNSTVGGEFNLGHTFELGGKRSSRIDKAEKILSVFDQKKLIKQQEVVIELLLTLHRIRQLEHELELFEESSKTYSSVRQRFKKRPRLSPDQEMSSNIYFFAINENQQHIRILKSERLALLQKVRLFLGKKSLEVEKLLPQAYTTWPSVDLGNLKQSPFLILAKKKVNLSESLYNLEKSLAWSNLKVGPAFDFQTGASGFQPNVGANFSFTVPLYHQNQGQKKYAKKGIQVSKLKVEQVEKKINLLRDSFLEIYDNSTKSLNIQKTLKLVEAKHKRLHQLLRRGIVHTSLVIELHRQEFQLIRASHENELNALRALWGIYSINGTIFKETTK